MSYQELIHTYPPEQWVEETEERDGYCAACAQGEPCRERIICDIADIQDNLEAIDIFVDDVVVLTWLHEQRYSTLTHNIRQLATLFLEHPHTVYDSVSEHVTAGISTIASPPPTDADMYQELALAGAHS